MDYMSAALVGSIGRVRHPQSAADIAQIMFVSKMASRQLHFAPREALAHLNKLCFDGALKPVIGHDTVIRFEAN